MELVKCQLIDGFTDDAGVAHRNVVMRRPSMQDEIAIKSDEQVQDLVSSGLSMDSKNQVIADLALTEWLQFNIVRLKQIIQKIGPHELSYIRSHRVLEQLTKRDILRMMNALSGSSRRLIAVDDVISIVDSVITNDDTRDKLKKGILNKVGEAVSADEQSDS